MSVPATDYQFFYHPKDRMRLTVGEEKSYITVKPAWCSPISHPGKYIAFLDGKDKEIVTVNRPESLSLDSWEVVKEELRRRYLTSEIVRIDHAKVEFGATYWHVTSDRGQREFVTQSLQENAVWMSDDQLLLIDVDGNRFEIPSIAALDERSKSILNAIV